MKKKIWAALISLVLCLCTVAPAFVAQAEGFTNEYQRVQDLADILTDSEEAALSEKLEEICNRQKMDIVILTEPTLDGKSNRDFADDVYDYCGYGYGEKKDGLLFLISMDDRQCYISTHGYAITAFTDAGIAYIGTQMREDLSDKKYSKAFDTFADLCDDFVEQARKGKPYDKGNLPKEPLAWYWILISLAGGVALAFVVVGKMKGKLKTVRFQAAAGNYMKNGSLNVTEQRDMFLYSTVSRKAKPKNDDSDSGGSSTHSSSSGETHGGGGFSF